MPVNNTNPQTPSAPPQRYVSIFNGVGAAIGALVDYLNSSDHPQVKSYYSRDPLAGESDQTLRRAGDSRR